MEHRTDQPPQQPSPVTEPWEAGVIARYLTVGGATVDLTGGGHATRYRCTGCGDGTDIGGNEGRAREIAQGHAEKCRALPRPGVQA